MQDCGNEHRYNAGDETAEICYGSTGKMWELVSNTRSKTPIDSGLSVMEY